MSSPHTIIRPTIAPNPTYNKKAFGNCIPELKRTGRLPDGSVSPTNLAKDVPIKPVDLQPGMRRVVRTTEGPVGHLVEIWINEEGQAISVTEGGHYRGEGRIVPSEVIEGEVISAISQ